jgi:hypothetical protein
MNELVAFQVDELYTNDQIRFSLGLENLGGIRPSLDAQKRLRHVAIMTAVDDAARLIAENPYHDRIEGDVLLYTAQGREGDQNLTGRNRRLVEQYVVPVPFYGFANVGRQTYRFLGMLELLRHYPEIQADRRGVLRNVWVCEFRIHRRPEIVSLTEAGAISAALLARSRAERPDGDLDRVLANPTEPEFVTGSDTSAVVVERLRGQLLQVPPARFERLIRSLMEVSGFVSVSVTRASGDGGIDIDARVADSNDFFAGTHVQVQVKRWRHTVGSVEINGFRGALSPSAKGIFVTTSQYTRAAIDESRVSNKLAITLIDGLRLSNMVVRSGIDISRFDAS